jgi:6-phosphogluconolactonase
MSTPLATAMLILIGTYTNNTGSQGIYAVRLDPQTGALSAPVLAVKAGNPSFLALAPGGGRVYAVSEFAPEAEGFALDVGAGTLRPLAAPQGPRGRSPCHLALDATGRMAVVTQYGDGYVASVAIGGDGSLSPAATSKIQHAGRGPHPTRQEKAHVHSATFSPDNRFAFVCDLGLDRIYCYRVDPGRGALAPHEPAFTATAPGAGPRHSKFSGDGHHLYVINELNGTIDAFAYDGARGALTHLQAVPTLPADFTGENTCAEIRVHPNDRFVYGSNRGHDSLAVFAREPATGRLTFIERVPSGGAHPRNFALSPDGGWLVCANRDSHNLVVFKVDGATGRLTRTAHTASVRSPVCVLFTNTP